MHHLIATIAASCGFLAGSFNTLVAAATLITELSTIMLHIRFYMIKSKNADGNAFIVVMLVFIGLFAYSRMYV